MQCPADSKRYDQGLDLGSGGMGYGEVPLPTGGGVRGGTVPSPQKIFNFRVSKCVFWCIFWPF